MPNGGETTRALGHRVTITLHTRDLERLDAMVNKLQQQRVHVSRSGLIRYALRQLEPESVQELESL